MGLVVIRSMDSSRTDPSRLTNGHNNSHPASPSESSSSQNVLRSPNHAIVPPTASRMRNPPPPSPLSRIQSSQERPVVPVAPPSRSITLPVPHIVGENSPCFIHSHLDRHGSLQDWLKSKSNQPHPSHASSQQTHAHSNHPSLNGQHTSQRPQKQPPFPQSYTRPFPNALSSNSSYSPSSSRVVSPTTKDGSISEYESERSSSTGVGSAILDGDLMDDEEAAGSLTKQLAETAQGVREMSKELG